MVKALFGMQFLASGCKTPNVAVHYALLGYIHNVKMYEQVSTHGFANASNKANEDVIIRLLSNYIHAHFYIY